MVAVVFWSAGNIIVREAPMNGLRIAAWRLLYGAIIYLLLLHIRGRRTSWAHIKIATPAAVVIALEIALFFVAIKLTTIASVTIIGSLQPIVLLVVASRQFNERISRVLIAASVVLLPAHDPQRTSCDQELRL